jgi:putative ABC transport system permease protein
MQVSNSEMSYGQDVAVGGLDAVQVVNGTEVDDDARAALADGRAVVLSPVPVDEITIDIQRPGEPDQGVRLPAVSLTSHVPSGASGVPLVFISPKTAERFGAGTQVQRVVWVADSAVTAKDLEEATTVLRSAGFGSVPLERDPGYESRYGLALLAMLIVSALVTVTATAVATGLAAAEGRADLATLAAVGASPWVRRSLSMAQAGSIALTGALLGVLAGLVPAYAVLEARVGDYPYVVPWGVVGVLVVAVPLLAAALAGLFVRSRLPMVARID